MNEAGSKNDIKVGLVQEDKSYTGLAPATTKGYRTLVTSNGFEDFDVTVRLYKKAQKNQLQFHL